MSDPTRDPSKGFYDRYPDNRRRGTSTYRDGRPDDEDADDDYRIPNQHNAQNSSRGYPYNGPRSVNPRSSDVGHYFPEQQAQLNAYAVTPLNPLGNQVLVNRDAGNSSMTSSKDSHNRIKSSVTAANTYHAGSSSTDIGPIPISSPHFPVNPSDYEHHSAYPAPSIQPSKSDRSYKQRVDPRQHHGTDIHNLFQAKSSYPYSQEQEQASTIPTYDNDGHYPTSKRDPRSMPSNRYQEGTSSREWASHPDAPSRSSQPRTKEHGRRLDNSSDDWGDDDEPNLRNESAPKTYSHNSQRSRVNTLAPPSSSWTGKEGDFAYGSPPTSQSMSSSTETLRPDNIHRPPKKKYQDSGPSQEYDGPWVSETKDYGSAPLASSGNPSSLPPVVSKPSRSTSLPTSSLPSQPIPITQGGRSVSQIPQGSSTYGMQYGSALDSRDHHTPSDFQGNIMYGSPPTRPPALTRGVSDPPRQSQGESWHNIPPTAIQPQTSSRNRPRQDESADKIWAAPTNQSYGFNPSGSGSSSNNNNNRGFGDERTVSGRSNMSQPSTRSIPLPNAPQYSNEVAPGIWSGPTSTSPPGAMFPGPAIFPQPFAGNYEQDLSQRFAQTSMNNSSRMPLGTIPEVQQQSVVNSKPSLHRPDMSVTSLLTTSTSTIPDKYISIGSPYLSPLRHKSHEGLQTVGWRRRKPTDTDNYISLYMTSPIVDEDTTPLWTPCPKYRATTRQWHSVEVGDIGYLEESGEFTTLFNIFHSHKGNIRRGAQPPPPHHFNKLAAQMSDVVTEVPLQRGHFYLSENIERHSGTPQGSFQFTFKRKSGRSGAIIVLPHGGTKSTLRSKFFQYPHVKQYFRENAAAWYQHVNAHPDIPNLPNGSLIFVHGTHLARTWGIATFLSKHSVREPERILFAPTDYSNPYEYQWDWTSEKWKVKSGPSPEELRNGQLLENQCIGIIGSSVVLDNQTWQSFFSNSPTSATSSSSRKAGGSFGSRILSRVSSISSIKVGDRPSGRRYMASYLETQRGYEDDLFRMDVN